MRRRRLRPCTTRERILDELHRMIRDTMAPAPRPDPPPCSCDECRLARAVDVSPNPRVLQVQPAEYQRMLDLAGNLKMPDEQLAGFTLRMFGKVPVMLREVEAAAIIAHMERGDL